MVVDCENWLPKVGGYAFCVPFGFTPATLFRSFSTVESGLAGPICRPERRPPVGLNRGCIRRGSLREERGTKFGRPQPVGDQRSDHRRAPRRPGGRLEPEGEHR